MKLLVYSSLYPNSVNPQHGIFVETRLRQLLRRHPVAARVIAPVPWFPFRQSIFGSYGAFARIPRAETRHGIKIDHPRYPVIPKIGMRPAAWTMEQFTLPDLRTTIAAGFDFDLIDAHYFYPDGVAAVRLARKLNRPCVISARGSDINVISKLDWARGKLVAAAEAASAIVAVSRALKQKMIEIGMPEKKIAVLPNGVDTSFFTLPAEVATDRFGLSSDLVLLGFAGNLVPVKGVDLIVAAMSRLPQCGLLIAGDGPLRTKLTEQVAALGLERRVRFVGRLPQEELRRFYGVIDVLLLASASEGWPNVLLEAMACGTPVVAPPIPGMDEIVQQSVAGRIAVSRTAPALADAVADILAARPSRHDVRAYAEEFGWEATSRGLYDLFTRIVNQNAA